MKATDSGPFNLSPDPRFLYITAPLRTALHKIRYVIDRRQGITAVLGDYGLGKSSLMRLVYDDYATREDTRVILIPSPSFKSEFAFVRTICLDFGLAPRRSMVDQQREFEGFVGEVYAAEQNVVIMIDEGQGLTVGQLEIIRNLLNFETNTAKLVQVVLAGQLELRDRLLEKRLGALRSRIFAPTLLSPLSLLETDEMLAFRASEAQIRNPFPKETVEAIYRVTAGRPREVLKTAAMAYEFARLAGEEIVPPEAIEVAAAEASMALDATSEAVS